MSNKFFVIFAILFFHQMSFAQIVFLSQEKETSPHLKQSVFQTSALQMQNPVTINATDTYLPIKLKSSYEYYQATTETDCLNEKVIDYAISLTIKGQYKECYDFAKTCLLNNSEKLAAPLIIQGARCAGLSYEYQKAYDLFKSGLNVQDLKNTDLASAYLLEFASFAMASSYANEVDAIINAHPNWTVDEKASAKGLIEFLVQGQPKEVLKSRVFDFIESEITKSKDFYSRQLKSIRISSYLQDYRDQKAYEYLVQDAVELTNPLDWTRQGFNILYAISNGYDFSSAKNFYLAYLPNAHSRVTFLPTERNVDTYSEIYEKDCVNEMLQGPTKLAFKNQIQSWKQGSLDISTLVDSIKNDPGLLKKSDAMSTLGSLQAIQGQYEEAQKSYWAAHLLCPYNNRAHWGIVLLERRKKYLSFPEFNENEKYVEDTMLNILFPKEVEQFIPNFNSFPVTSQKRIKFAARIWAPYVQQLYKFGSLVYIKLPFELLSEVPGLEDLYNRRIGPPDMPNYFFDNRLWDDVRGAGGNTVAADHDEVFQTVHGDYNLLGHEMTHQFHNYIKIAKPNLNDCVNKLYEGAQKRNVFPDGYAKSVVAEYFAQGITYYLIPENFPARYGVNRSWAVKNDPDLHQFIKSIENSGGDLDKIICPI